MSNKKEILDLLSQAEQYRIKAHELESRAKVLHYADTLEEWGIMDGEIVQLKECKVRVCGLSGSISKSFQWLDSVKLKKDGSDSAFHKTIYHKEEIIK